MTLHPERSEGVAGNDSVWSPARRMLTIGLVLTVTLVAFEALAVATILPGVARELQGLTLYGWPFSAFFLGSLVGIALVGGQVDERGMVRPFVAGLALFGLGLAVGGLAPSMAVLIGGRLIQGLGAGAIPSVAYVAIGREYPASLRPRMFAILSTAWVVPGLVGPALAGTVADHLSWRLVFLGLLPLIVVSGLLTLPALASATAVETGRERAGPGLLPALRTAGGSGLILAALTETNWLLALVLAMIGVALAIPGLRALLPPGTLRAARGLPTTVLSRGVLMFGFSGAEAFLPLALVSIRGTSASQAGLALTAATLTWTAGAWIQARTTQTVGTTRLIRLGFGVVAAGIVGMLSVLSPDVPVPTAVFGWGVAGLGMGLAYSSISIAVLHAAPRGREGAATSGMQLADVLGTALGTGACGAVVAYGSAAGWEPRLALLAAFGLAVGSIVAGLLVTGRLAGRPRGPSVAATT